MAKARRRVLLVSYLLPPAGGVGVQRPLSYLRYLPGCGCEVVALTCRNPVTPVYDPSLSGLIPAGTRIERARTFELPHRFRDRIWKALSRGRKSAAGGAAASAANAGSCRTLRAHLSRMVEALATPDPQKAWIPMATRRAMQLCGREQFDAVLVSVPPFSSLQVGVQLKRRFPHLTLISDFRDEWVGYYLAELGPAPSPYRLRVAESQEKAAVEASDYVVAVTEMQKDSIRGRYPNEPAGKFLTIHNGYDPEVFAALQGRPHGGSRLRVGYVGTIYGHDVSSPRPWIEALNGLVPDEMDRIETHFVGRVEPDAAAVLERARTPISCTGFLSQRAALEEMMQCDALLLIVANMNALTGKVFEYLASGKPILCLTLPGSVAAKVIEETQSGWWADYRDPEAVRELVRRAVEWKRTGEGLQRDAKRIEAFSRPALVAELVRLTGLGSPILLEL